ncbi:DUF6346 domain-containing protein [Actinoplanes sp. KI2]|uniref:DUF6346 domain-containing protein n=1 Tax=Actinoplanes sp. KI2 TaxID=2983315 RepID=UPI0021D5826B|nr:DUF6346 domain-containing protein [Actinoplanes sp. KI2]MCU7725294.1 DUF6346 domain-containing protein [Actinoplanes sp. KI2]
MTDDDRRAARRRRMDELLAEAEADVTRTRAARNSPAEAPVVDQRRGTALGSVAGVLVLLLLAAVFMLVSATVGRFTGPDYHDAARHGTATVEQCQRHGPITWHGFGYFDACTVSITWSDGAGPRVLIDKPGFMKGEKPGDTFEIGQNQGTRGAISYSRPEQPARGWVTAITILFGLLAFLCVGAVYLFIRQTIKDIRRPKA